MYEVVIMAIGDLNQKYTIEKYCTKNDLAKIFGTQIVEPIWNQLSEFRKQHSIELSIFDASRTRFKLIYIDSTQVKTAEINNHITLLVTAYSKLQAGSTAYYTFTRDMLKNSIRAIAQYNKLDATEVTISNLLNGQEVSGQYKILERYNLALQILRTRINEPINEEFLAKYYAILRGEEELTCFYRTTDVQTLSSKVLVARDYDQGIPSRMIDEIMPVLLDNISNNSISLVTRLSSIFFMFNYVKPFDKFNMELACLLAKRIIAGTNAGTASIYIPIESFINDKEFFNEISREVKRTHDFTYAFLKGADLANGCIDVSKERLDEVQSTIIDTEVKIGSDERKIEEEFGQYKAQPKPVQPKTTETKAQIQARLERNALHLETENLSEKELRAKANQMMEIDPYLNKHQANFYVHHCTPGRYYTLQQYVKFTGCVYETARTSMELLAKQGYYRQETIKNKFVYTPINKE